MSADNQRDEFARLFARNDRWLYAYLMTLLGNPSDTEEVFQEVCVVLWREFEVFDLGSDFRKWVSVIARHRVMQYRAKKSRQAAQLSEDVIDMLADEALQRTSELEERSTALHDCLDSLSESDRRLVAACYSDMNRSYKRTAEYLGMSVNTLYKALQRTRKALRTCVERRIAAQG